MLKYLSKAYIEAIEPTGKIQSINAGPALLLVISKNGRRKSWVVRLNKDGKETRKTLGHFPGMTHREARSAAEEAKRSFQSMSGNREITLGMCLQEWQKSRTVSEGVRRTSENRHNLWGPMLSKPLTDISRRALVDGLLKILRERSRIVAHQVALDVSAAFRFALNRGWIETTPAERLAGALPAAPAAKHRYTTTDPTEVGALMRGIKEVKDPFTQGALLLVAYLFPRVSELLKAEWTEIEGDIWTIPAAHTKRKKSLRVPLPRQALEVLERLHGLTGGKGLVFPGAKDPTKQRDRTGLLIQIRSMGVKGQTVHGFRALATSQLAKMGFPSEWVEAALSHSAEETATRAAYMRYDYLEERRGMMQAYADWLDGTTDRGERPVG